MSLVNGRTPDLPLRIALRHGARRDDQAIFERGGQTISGGCRERPNALMLRGSVAHLLDRLAGKVLGRDVLAGA